MTNALVASSRFDDEHVPGGIDGQGGYVVVIDLPFRQAGVVEDTTRMCIQNAPGVARIVVVRDDQYGVRVAITQRVGDGCAMRITSLDIRRRGTLNERRRADTNARTWNPETIGHYQRIGCHCPANSGIAGKVK